MSALTTTTVPASTPPTHKNGKLTIDDAGVVTETEIPKKAASTSTTYYSITNKEVSDRADALIEHVGLKVGSKIRVRQSGSRGEVTEIAMKDETWVRRIGSDLTIIRCRMTSTYGNGTTNSWLSAYAWSELDFDTDNDNNNKDVVPPDNTCSC